MRLLILALLLSSDIAFAADPATEKGFLAAYRGAREQKDLKQMMALVHPDHLTEADKTRFADGQRVLWSTDSGSIKNVELRAGPPEGVPLERVVDGITRRS